MSNPVVQQLKPDPKKPTIWERISWYVLDYLPYRFRHQLYDLRDYFFPRQRWLTKQIRKGWMEKDEIIRIALYSSIIHLVDEDGCFEWINWDHCEEHKEVAAFIKDCYDWIKEERPALEKEIARIIDEGSSGTIDDIEGWINNINNDKRTYDQKYPNLRNLEQELDDKDTHYLTNIVKYRHFLWT